jgi:NTP pyrophosphatase (non-canonical NTP hydrolase)
MYILRMNFNEYQGLAARTDNVKTGKEGQLLNAVVGMVGEAAECLELVKKHIWQDHSLDETKLLEEAGDVLWYIAKLARIYGIPLEELAVQNIKKLEARYPEGTFIAERSINRDTTSNASTIDSKVKSNDSLPYSEYQYKAHRRSNIPAQPRRNRKCLTK